MKEIKKGKNEFTQKEVDELILLIRRRCNASKEEQKSIRRKMRSIGFYGGDDFGITDMTVEKFNKLISDGSIKIKGKLNSTSVESVKTFVEKAPVLSNNNKQGLEAWCGDEPYVLILGTLPGDESLRLQAYYQNKSHNSFYKIMERLFERESGASDKDFVLSHHIALWDCMKEAEREGSTDAKIKDGSIVPNEIEQFLILHPTITTICLNGTGKTTDTFNNYFCVEELEKKFKIISLPSTSNACGKSFEEKFKAWSVVKDIVESANKKTI